MNSERYELVLDWKKDCVEHAKIHGKLAIHMKRKYFVFGLMQLLIPIGFTLANQIILDLGTSSTVASVGFALTGVTTIILNFLNFKVLSTKHEQANTSYINMLNEIDSSLSKSHNPPDVLVVKIRNEMSNLLKYSPNTDSTCMSDRCF